MPLEYDLEQEPQEPSQDHNCVDLCPYTDENLECNGECVVTYSQQYSDDIFSTEHRSPALKEIEGSLNGGW